MEENIDNVNTVDKTKINQSHLSGILGISLRGWIVLIVVCTACAMFFTEKTMPNELYMLLSGVVGQYFGQKNDPYKNIN